VRSRRADTVGASGSGGSSGWVAGADAACDAGADAGTDAGADAGTDAGALAGAAAGCAAAVPPRRLSSRMIEQGDGEAGSFLGVGRAGAGGGA
jgi:hypothetical protein